jgi:hypothetical protein
LDIFSSSSANEEFLSYIQLKFTNLKYFTFQGQILDDHISTAAISKFVNYVFAIAEHSVESFYFDERWREVWLMSQLCNLPSDRLVAKKLKLMVWPSPASWGFNSASLELYKSRLSSQGMKITQKFSGDNNFTFTAADDQIMKSGPSIRCLTFRRLLNR